jgi:hypothetical protein
MREAHSICEKASKDLSERVADVKPRHPLSLLVLLIPHCNDENKDRRDASFEDAEESSTY